MTIYYPNPHEDYAPEAPDGTVLILSIHGISPCGRMMDGHETPFNDHAECMDQAEIAYSADPSERIVRILDMDRKTVYQLGSEPENEHIFDAMAARAEMSRAAGRDWWYD